MSGGPQFIEVTEAGSDETMIIGLAFISRIRKDPRNDAAVIEWSEGGRVMCKESYETVRLALLNSQPPPEAVNYR